MDYYVSAKWGLNALEEANLITDIAQKAAKNSANTTIQVFPGLDHDFRPTADICTDAELDLEDRRQNNEPESRPLDDANSLAALEFDDLKQRKSTYSKDFQRDFQQWVLAKFRLDIL